MQCLICALIALMETLGGSFPVDLLIFDIMNSWTLVNLRESCKKRRRIQEREIDGSTLGQNQQHNGSSFALNRQCGINKEPNRHNSVSGVDMLLFRLRKLEI